MLTRFLIVVGFLCSTVSAQTPLHFAEGAVLDGDLRLATADWILVRMPAGSVVTVEVLEDGLLVETSEYYLGKTDTPVAGFGSIPHRSNDSRYIPSMTIELGAKSNASTLALRGNQMWLNQTMSASVHALEAGEDVRTTIQAGPFSERGFSSEMSEVPFGPMFMGAGPTQIAGLTWAVHAVEWFDMDVSCSAVYQCPDGGGYSASRFGAQGTSTGYDEYRFDKILAPAIVSLESDFSRMALGSSIFDLSVRGIVELPYASLEECDQCPLISGQNLHLSGEILLRGIQVSQGRMAATLTGNLTSARVDETWVDPQTLGKFGTAAATAVGIGLVIKLLALPLFTRLAKAKALEHPNRKVIFEYVQQHPGANFREVARKTNIPAGTVRHHLTVLQRSGHLVEHAHKGTVRLFENHGKFDHNWSTLVFLREPLLAQLHAWIEQHPQSAQKAILEGMEQQGWNRSTTQHRLTRLVQGGLLTVRLQGRLKLYSVSAPPKPVVGLHQRASRTALTPLATSPATM